MEPAVCVCGKKVSSRLTRCPYCKAPLQPSLVAPPLPPDEPAADTSASTASTLLRIGAAAILLLGVALAGVGCWRASVPAAVPAGELALGTLVGAVRVEGATLEWDQKMYLVTGKDGRQFTSKSPREGVEKVPYRDFLSRSASYVGRWVRIDGAPNANVALKSIWVRQARYSLGPGTKEDRPSPILAALSDDVWVASDDVMSLNSPDVKTFMQRGSFEGRVQRLRDVASGVSAGWSLLSQKYRELSHRQVPDDAVVILTGRPYEGTVTATYVPILEAAGKVWAQFDGEVTQASAPPLVGAPLDTLPPERASAPELEGMRDVIAVGKAAGPVTKMRAFGGTGALGIVLALVAAAVLIRRREAS
jgi:hypothetical protein